MKKILFIAIGLVMACNSSQKTVTESTTTIVPEASPVVYAKNITEAELKDHLYIYASDEFKEGKPENRGKRKPLSI